MIKKGKECRKSKIRKRKGKRKRLKRGKGWRKKRGKGGGGRRRKRGRGGRAVPSTVVRSCQGSKTFIIICHKFKSICSVLHTIQIIFNFKYLAHLF